MGTMIQELKLTEEDYRGERFKDFHRDVKGNNELLALTQRAALKEIHMEYLKAGSDIIETNTFTANRVSQADYDMQDLSYEIKPVWPVKPQMILKPTTSLVLLRVQLVRRLERPACHQT